MLIAILAFVALAATAAVVIRDADPNAGARAVPAAQETPTAEQHAEAPVPEPEDPPTQAMDMTVVGFPQVGSLYDPTVDAPTESMPALAVGGGQAAAILPYPAHVDIEPIVAADTATSPDPDRLIQTVVFLDQGANDQSAALARLLAGMAIAGGVVGLSLVGIGRFISMLLGH